jgi:uncharacterized protein YdhG (YjbR/CyaY superfamily)
MAQAKPTTIDEYMAGLSQETRGPFQALRQALLALMPGTTEVMSYGMPTLRYRDRVLVHFAAWKNHLALYGLDVAGHAGLLASYDTDKGTIRFPPEEAPSRELLATLINDCVAEIDAARDAKRPRRAKAAR